MLPDELYKRRHYGTPQSMLLIVANFTVFTILLSLFADQKHTNWFFWVAMGLLALYNFFNIRKDREEYTRVRIIAYAISLAIMAAMFFIFRAKA